MDMIKLTEKYNQRKEDAIKWMEQNYKGFVLDDEFLSPYSENTVKILNELDILFDKYKDKYGNIPPVAIFPSYKQKELLTDALKHNLEIDVDKMFLRLDKEVGQSN